MYFLNIIGFLSIDELRSSHEERHYVNILPNDHTRNALIMGYNTNNYQNFMLRNKDLECLPPSRQSLRPKKRQAPLPPPMMEKQGLQISGPNPQVTAQIEFLII